MFYRQPIRIGELWYLNVHGGEPFTWIQCDAELYRDRLVLSWMPEGSRGSRGVVTLDLAHCQGGLCYPAAPSVLLA